MQSVMNLVWDKLLPAMKPSPLRDDRAARKAVQGKLARLIVKMPAGPSNGAAAARVSRWYEFPKNDSGIEAVQLELNRNRQRF